MSFLDASAYDRFMGRYSMPLAPQFADFAGIRPGQRVLDVGCGPGALTAILVERVGAGSVSAVDPSPPFVEAARERFPGVDIRQAAAEQLPYEDDTFEAAVAQLVVHFMRDAGAGLREMARVTRPGGVVAACVWDLAGDRSPISALWTAARQLNPTARDEAELAGGRQGQLVDLVRDAGLQDVEEGDLAVTVEHATFEQWWEPFTLGVGPAGSYVAGLEDRAKAELRECCRALLPDAPFEITVHAWAARGVV